MAVSQLVTAQGHIFGIQRGWVGDTNLIPTDLKHLLAEWPSQIVNRDNPAQGHKSHLCHLSPCGQGTFLCQAGVPIPGKWGSTESLSQSLGNFPLRVSTARSQHQTLSNSCNYRLLPGAVRKRHQILEQRKGSAFGNILGKAAKGFTVPQSGLNPHPKIPNFYTNPGRKSCHSRGGKHIHPFIGGSRDGLRLCAGTAQAPETEGDSECLRGKPLLGEAGKGSRPCQNPGSRGSTSIVPLNPALSQGRGVVSLLSHEEFTTVDSLGLDSGRDGVGGLRGVWQHGASRRGRGNAFLVSFLQILWEERKENGGVRGKGWSCQRVGRCQVFSNHWASRTSASACG